MRNLSFLASLRPLVAPARRLGLPVLSAAAIGVWVAGGGAGIGVVYAAVVYASAEGWLADQDGDGLPVLQEQIMGTSDDHPDTDGDGFDDLVELARGSDPTNAASIPAAQSVHVGMTARADGGVVTLVSAIYVHHLQFPEFGYALGGSYAGVEFTLAPSTVLAVSKIQLYSTLDPSGWIIVIETPIPQSLVAAFGYFGVFSIVSESGVAGPHAAAVLNLFEVAGQVLALKSAPSDMAGGGSIYQPLGRGDDLPASTWTEGEVCWQLTQVVGTDGSSVILDVEDASCQPLDSVCNAAQCQGGIGTQFKVLDAGALTGGG